METFYDKNVSNSKTPISFADMKEKITELILKASNLFMTCGIKSLTMNDIASKLGISKKTLYNYVSDKNDLVDRCIGHHIELNQCEMQNLIGGANNAIEELINMSQHAGKMINTIHPSIFYDLQKYHPEAWNKLQTFEETVILEMNHKNLERGIKEGLYRPDLNIDVISKIYLSLVQNIFKQNNPISEGVSLSDYYTNVFNYHIRGIASAEGIKLINQSIN